jgi:diamine N-acetyltransferase
MKRHLSCFGSGQIRLRLIADGDLEATLAWRNRDDARVWFKSSAPLVLHQHRVWFEQYRERDDDYLFIVEADGNAVGQASVYNIDWQRREAEIGRFLIAPEAAAKGHMTAACSELILFCATEFKLAYLFLEVLANNDRAIRLYRRHGFVEERRYSGLIRMGRILLHREEAGERASDPASPTGILS